jgi:hypothetical protein
MKTSERGTWQSPMPLKKTSSVNGYDIWPAFRLEEGLIHAGYRSLADRLLEHSTITIDGYNGISWNRLEAEIMAVAAERGLKVRWIPVAQFLKPEDVIREMTAPGQAGMTPVWQAMRTPAG